jgi:hypothetical protein
MKFTLIANINLLKKEKDNSIYKKNTLIKDAKNNFKLDLMYFKQNKNKIREFSLLNVEVFINFFIELSNFFDK